MISLRFLLVTVQGKRNETAKKNEYVAELKALYKARMERNTSVDARPWRK